MKRFALALAILFTAGVAAADTRILFQREYSFSGHVAASGTRDSSGTRNGPLFNFSTWFLNRRDQSVGMRASFLRSTANTSSTSSSLMTSRRPISAH